MAVFNCHVCGNERASDEFVNEVLEVDGPAGAGRAHPSAGLHALSRAGVLA
ncbi:MAG TPA: hypothetical protein VMT29_18195 [Steroidobacteraceae bacterium]|nr:hypothetical protein [Steroidobacteraceae bacterium]